MDRDVVGYRIRRRRRDLRQTQAALAEAMQLRGHAGLTQNRISEIERGQRKVTPAELAGFSRVLQISADWLLGLTDRGGD